MAKFIPRTDFLYFSHDGEGNGGNEQEKLQVAIAGNNASRLVSICSRSGYVRKLNNVQQKVDVYDGDIIILHWYSPQKNGKGGLEPLLRFRLDKTKAEQDNTGVAVDREQVDNQAHVSLLVEADKIKMGSNLAEIARSSMDNTNVKNPGEEKKVEAPAKNRRYNESEGSLACNHWKDDRLPPNSTDYEHLKKASSFLNTATKKDGISRGNCFRNVQANDENQCSTNDAQQKMSHPGSSGLGLIQPPLEGDASCTGSTIGRSMDDEEESESAPLTLPSQFLASYSKSFDSTEKSHPHSPKILGDDVEQKYSGTPQKSNHSSKRTIENIKATTQAKDTTKTPKKSNVTNAGSESSFPMNSLSYDQLVQLHKDSVPSTSVDQPSLRHTVLSLTLALTSNASSYDSNFLRDCNLETDGHNKTNERISQQHTRQHWVPRLLQGTQILENQTKVNNS